jgi:tetratricopeptide (TPR) repeat protein
LVQLMIVLQILTMLKIASAQSTPVSAQLSFQNDTVHLELLGRESWDYDLKRVLVGNRALIQLEVPSLKSQSIEEVKKFSSQLIKSVKVLKGSTAGKDTLVFELAKKQIESFDYLTDEPSRLIVDFYNAPEDPSAVTPSPSVEKTKLARDSKKPKALVPDPAWQKSLETKTAERGPANEIWQVSKEGPLNVESSGAAHGLFDGADPGFERFSMKDYEVKEESIIRNRDRVYIPFPWHLETPKKWDEVTESGSVYHVHPSTTTENKNMRLLLKLFEKKRNHVFLQTKEWFNSSYPKSQYNELIDFMTADIQWRLYEQDKKASQFDKAMQAYKAAVRSFPKSPMAEKTSLMIPIRYFQKGDYLAAMRAFQQHVENQEIVSSSPLSKDLARLGLALTTMHLGRFDEATQLLNQLESESSDLTVKQEAAYRRGDVDVLSRNFARAVESYSNAQKKYPQAENQFPNSFYNKSEAQFWLGNYRKSLDHFRDYIKRFPSDNFAPLALTRIGENMEILGADKSRSMGAYLETYFRYGETPYAIIARIRMTAARMKNMKPKEAEIATQQILDLAKKVSFKDVDKLATILIAEGFSERAEFGKATDLLIGYFQKNPTMPDKEQFANRIVANINESIRESVEQGDFMQAFKIHQKYADNRLKGSNRLDTRYFLGRSFEMAGVPKESERYYREIVNRLQAIEGTSAEKEIKVFEHVPSREQLFLRLSQSQAKQGKLQIAYDSLRQVKAVEGLNEDEQIERVILSADLLTAKENFDSAKRFVLELLRTWRGEPDKMVQPYMKLAEIEEKMNQPEAALASLKKVDELMVDSKNVKSDVVFKSLERRIEIAEKLKSTSDLISATERMLELFEEDRSIASIRYKLGDVYFKRGQVKKAEEIWAGFKGANSDFWGRLAQEQIKNLGWRDDYKKYIERIPAMSRKESK